MEATRKEVIEQHCIDYSKFNEFDLRQILSRLKDRFWVTSGKERVEILRRADAIQLLFALKDAERERRRTNPAF